MFIVDRKKDMILTAGFNIYAAELERVVAGHPDVALVAVGCIHDEEKGVLAHHKLDQALFGFFYFTRTKRFAARSSGSSISLYWIFD